MESRIYNQARLQVQKKVRFYNHLKGFLIVNIFLFLLSKTNIQPFEYLQGIFVWGLGLLGHFIMVFGLPGNGLLSKDWETREIEREVFLIRKKMEIRQKPNSEAGEGDFDLDDPLELRVLQRNYDETDLV